MIAFYQLHFESDEVLEGVHKEGEDGILMCMMRIIMSQSYY
jgi:hypothetical protein